MKKTILWLVLTLAFFTGCTQRQEPQDSSLPDEIILDDSELFLLPVTFGDGYAKWYGPNVEGGPYILEIFQQTTLADFSDIVIAKEGYEMVVTEGDGAISDPQSVLTSGMVVQVYPNDSNIPETTFLLRTVSQQDVLNSEPLT